MVLFDTGALRDARGYSATSEAFEIGTRRIAVTILCCERTPRRIARRSLGGDKNASLATAGDHVGLIVEPESPALAQNLARGLEITPVGHDLSEPVVLDLRHVDRCIPCGKKGRGADRVIRNLARQRVHVV